MPPCVGSGCRQISVAAGSRSSGSASSPTRFSPSSVGKVIDVRLAGRTVAALISCAMFPSLVDCSAATALHAPLPAHGMPVPPVGDAGVRRPDHDVRGAGVDLLIAAGAAVGLARRRAWHPAHHPVAIRPFLDPLRAEGRCWRAGLRPPALTRGHRHQGYPRPAPAKSHYSASVRLVIARCSVDYDGRLTAHLPAALRLLIVKADGSVLVHSDGGSYKPLNW